jgi:hypothetical protein
MKFKDKYFVWSTRMWRNDFLQSCEDALQRNRLAIDLKQASKVPEPEDFDAWYKDHEKSAPADQIAMLDDMFAEWNKNETTGIGKVSNFLLETARHHPDQLTETMQKLLMQLQQTNNGATLQPVKAAGGSWFTTDEWTSLTQTCEEGVDTLLKVLGYSPGQNDYMSIRAHYGYREFLPDDMVFNHGKSWTGTYGDSNPTIPPMTLTQTIPSNGNPYRVPVGQAILVCGWCCDADLGPDAVLSVNVNGVERTRFPARRFYRENGSPVMLIQSLLFVKQNDLPEFWLTRPAGPEIHCNLFPYGFLIGPKNQLGIGTDWW